MRTLYRLIAIGLVSIFSVLPAQAVLGPESFPAAFDELLKNQNLSIPAMIVIDGNTGAILYESVQEFIVAEVDGVVVGCGALHILWEDLAGRNSLVILLRLKPVFKPMEFDDIPHDFNVDVLSKLFCN